MKILVCADGYVGHQLVSWLIRQYRSDISAYVTTKKNEIYQLCTENNLNPIALDGRDLAELFSEGEFDLGLLLWWPHIISRKAIAVASQGFINTHPSLLPLHRGKHPNFWALKEGEPFGVSLHFLGSGIDDGDLIAQVAIPYDWTDDGESLYSYALEAMIGLFKQEFPQILRGDIKRYPLDLAVGNLHVGKELEASSFIDLNATYVARELINLLRARTFKGHPSCQFEDRGKRYEIRVTISEI